jgi:hypothetical protein
MMRASHRRLGRENTTMVERMVVRRSDDEVYSVIVHDEVYDEVLRRYDATLSSVDNRLMLILTDERGRARYFEGTEAFQVLQSDGVLREFPAYWRKQFPKYAPFTIAS